MKPTQLARKTLEAHFQNQQFKPTQETKQKYKGKKACFVTLTLNNQLRGCIGSLQPRQELWRNVQENTINAAFHDPRFPPLTKQELNKIKIEISVLTKPKKLEYKTTKELLDKINKNMGLILKKDYATATFLPQVWEQIPDKTQFLEHLSLKAGLEQNAWKSPETEIWFYGVEVEKES